jgi:hypothetical protein
VRPNDLCERTEQKRKLSNHHGLLTLFRVPKNPAIQETRDLLPNAGPWRFVESTFCLMQTNRTLSQVLSTAAQSAEAVFPYRAS